MRRLVQPVTFTVGMFGVVFLVFGCLSLTELLRPGRYGSRVDAAVLVGIALVCFVVAGSLIQKYGFTMKELLHAPIEREEQV